MAFNGVMLDEVIKMTVIYLTEPESYLEADSREFAIVAGEQIQSRHPIRDTGKIVVFEGCSVGRSARAAICRYQIPVFFIGDKGNIGAYFIPQKPLLYATLQRERNRDRNFCLSFIQSLLRGRWLNGIQVLQNMGYDAVGDCLERPLEILPGLNDTRSIKTWHWQVSHRYRLALNSMVVSMEIFEESVQLAHHFLSHELQVLLLASGCSSEVGTLHHHCYNHLPLPCDLMEQFRPIVEAWIAEFLPNLEVCEAVKKLHHQAFIEQWEQFINRRIFHDYAGWVDFREVLSWQVDEYVRAITEAVEYRPFLLR